MKRAYLLIYSDHMGTREQVKAYLDERPEISHWRYDLPNTFYLISDHSAQTLYEVVQEFNQKRGLFLICETAPNREGWLPKEAWTLLNEKKHTNKESHMRKDTKRT